MADSLKFSDRSHMSLEFERRQHLTNWLIQSSPHMPKVVQGFGKKAPPPPNPVWVQNGYKPTPPPPGIGMQMANSPLFTSQSNLPLQIFTAPYEGHKPKLRRFNSHDTSANMFSVTEFENARMANKTKIDLTEGLAIAKQSKQWLNQYDSMNRNSLNDCYSTSRGSSGGHSRLEVEETTQELFPIDKFLQKFILPKVVRIFSPNDQAEPASSIFTRLNELTSGKISSPQKVESTADKGKIMLVYRHISNRKIFHAHSAKTGNKQRLLKIPQELKGYFSLVNEKGQATATAYSKVIELVRERVYKFLTMENMVAYTESFSDVIPMKTHYTKTNIKAGQTFRLLAVFEDDRSRNQRGTSASKTSSDPNGTNQTDREKIRGRYVQILSDTRQMFYVPLTTKGKFYEVAVNQSAPAAAGNNNSNQSSNGMKNGSGYDANRKQDYLYRISDLVVNQSSFPLHLKTIYAPSFVDIPDSITVTDMSREDILVGCPISERGEKENRSSSPLSLAKVTVFPDIKVQKCLLGHKDERKLFASPVIQHMLEFCKINCETRLQAIEVENLVLEDRNCTLTMSSSQQNLNASTNNSPNNSNQIVSNNNSSSGGNGNQQNGGKRSKVESLKLLRPLNLSKFLHRDKNYVAHEVEDSIIFLTKSDLEKMETEKQQKQQQNQQRSVETNSTGDQQQTKNISDKMKVFEQEKRSWFGGDRKSKKTKTKSFTSYDLLQKKMSTDRYCDMSKMLQERFGEMNISNSSKTNNRPASTITANNTNTSNRSSSVTDVSNFLFDSRLSLNKTFSLENINFYDMKPRSRHSLATSQTPDLVRIINRQRFIDSSLEQLNKMYPTMSSHGSSGVIEPQSFISEKLYSEFHVKTRNHSKSSTNLNKWPFGISSTSTAKQNHAPERVVIENRTTIEKQPSSMTTVINITSDPSYCPYSLVQDSLENRPPVGRTLNKSLTDVNKEFITTNTEDMYAEICNNSNYHIELTNS